jgi:transitional endoplasmic reticulum ATPase
MARATAPCYLVFEDLDSIVNDNVRSFFLNQVDGLNNNDGILMIGSTNHLERLDPGISKRPSRFDRKYLFANPNFAERTLYAEFWRKKLLGDSTIEGEGYVEEKVKEKVEFPAKMCKAVAGITDGFSFAYIQEAFVASLLAIAARENEKEADYTLEGVNAKLPVTESDQLVRDYVEEILRDLTSGLSVKRTVHDGYDDGSDDKELDKLVLWREIKSQVKILRDEMGGPDEGDDK